MKEPVLVDFIATVKLIKRGEVMILNMLNIYDEYWETFKYKASTKLTIYKEILEDYIEFLKNSFFDTIKLQKAKEILEKFKPEKLS